MSASKQIFQALSGYKPYEWLIVGGLAYIFFAIATDAKPHDDTDPVDGRSGMRLFIDNKTGCHYLGGGLGGITPRLDQEGRHICEGR